MRTIAIINQKGGCGKTTTAINLSSVLAQKGYRTLLVDVDPQGHCALGLAVPDQQLERTIADVLRCGLDGSIAFSDITWQIAQNMDLAPASMSLAGIEQELSGAPDRDRRLSQVLALVSDRYDYCIIDCPPSIGLLTFNALRAAQEVVIPVETGYFAMQGAMRQEATIRMLARRAGHRVRFMVLATMYDVRTKLAREILAELRRHFGEQLLPVVVHFNSKLREASSFGQAITEYDASCTGYDDFDQLAEWLIHHPPEPLIPELANGPVENPQTPRTTGTAAVANPPPVGRTTPTPAAAPALSRAAELVERARALAARTAAIAARFNNDPALAPTPSILQPMSPLPVASTPPPTPTMPQAESQAVAIPTPSSQESDAARTNPLDTEKNMQPAAGGGLAALTHALPKPPLRRPPLASSDESLSDSSTIRACQDHHAATMAPTPNQPLAMETLAPARRDEASTATTTLNPVAPPATATIASLKNQISKLFGVRVTSQGLLFIQPLHGAQSMAVAGDFNHWNPNSHTMQSDPRLGIWQVCIKVPPGRYRYRLVIDGKWTADPYNPHMETNPFGELNNIIEAAADL